MTILPEFLQNLIAPHLNLLYHWFSDLIFQQLLADNSSHILVQIQRQFDFTPLEIACQAYHHQSGPGTKVTHSVSRLLRALIIKNLYGFSYLQTEVEVRNNLLMRWFVGYRLFEPVFDHTTLCRFEAWLRTGQPRLFFDAVLRQIDQDFPDQKRAVQIGDTFAMRAAAAEEDLVRLIRHACESLLADLEKESQSQYDRVVGGFDLGCLLGAPKERSEYCLSEAEWLARLQKTCLAAIDLCERVKSSGSPEKLPKVQSRLADLSKIFADELRFQTNAEGQIERVERLPSKQRGAYRIGSATDPQATYRHHGKKITLGYNVNLAGTPQGIIREIQAATGAQPDQAGVAALVEAQADHQQVIPSKLIYDQAAGAGKTRAQVAQVSQGQTQLVARIHTTAPPGRFNLADFSLAPDRLSITCPNGITTTTVFRSTNRDGRHFCWTAKQCQGCPLRDRCRNPKAKPSSERRIFVSDYLDEVRAAQAYNQTEAYREDMKLRPIIERVIAMLTRYDGARRARSQGQAKADFQAKMCGMARNFRTWMKLRQKRQQQQRVHPGLECAT